MTTSSSTHVSRPQEAQESDPSQAPEFASWSLRARRIATVLLLLHLAAISMAPAAVAPASQLATAGWSLFQPYLEAGYLNHGYHFFSPEPGPSHLIRFELTRADGTQIRGYFPDREQHIPRLLYHRHFMLSEHYNAMLESNAPAHLIQECGESMARHLLHLHQGTQVKLYLVRHLLPGSEQVRQGMKLDDDSLYRERPLGTFTENLP